MRSKTRLRERDEFRLAVFVVLVSAIGFVLPVALLWLALMLWHDEFKRRFDDRYLKSMLAGLIAAAIFRYSLSNALDLPPSWVAAILVTLGAWWGLRSR